MVCVCLIEKLATVPTKWSAQTHTHPHTHIHTNPAPRVRKQRPDSSCLNPDPLAQTNNTAHTHTQTWRHTHTQTQRLTQLWSQAITSTFECPVGSKFISSSASLQRSFVWLCVSGCVCVRVCTCAH